MSRPLDLAKFNTGDRDISILIKQKYFETIQIEYKGNSGDSVYIFGSFNNWKRGSNLMRPKNNSLSSDKQEKNLKRFLFVACICLWRAPPVLELVPSERWDVILSLS